MSDALIDIGVKRMYLSYRRGDLVMKKRLKMLGILGLVLSLNDTVDW